MSLKTLLILALITVLALSGGFQINFSGCKYRHNGNNYQVQIPCSGGSNPYSYSFANLPSGWGFDPKGIISIPQSQHGKPGNYPVKCDIHDNSGSYHQGSIVFVVTVDKISVQDKQYDYNNDFSKYDSKGKTFNSGKGISKGGFSDDQFDDYGKVYNDNLPRGANLNKIINGGDVNQITKVLTDAIASGLNCQDKIQYLLNFIGKIKAAIQVKKFRSDQLRKIIADLRDAIAKLNTQIDALVAKRNGLKCDDLKKQLAKAQTDLQAAIKAVNDAQAALNDQNVKLGGLQKQVSDLQGQVTAANKAISDDKVSLAAADANIQDLQKKLDEAKARRAQIQARIDANKKLIADAQGKINALQATITNLQSQIAKAQANIDKLKKAQADLQASVDSLKYKVTDCDKQAADLDKQIADLRAQVDKKSADLTANTKQFDAVEAFIKVLQGVLTKVQQVVNKLYCSCKGVQDKDKKKIVKNNHDAEEYSSDIFKKYIQNCYGNVPKFQISKQVIALCFIEIFSNDWENKYGIPFAKEDIKDGNDASSGFKSDFECSGKGDNGAGVITDIKKNVIYVKGDDNKSHVLNCGACSRIESGKDKDQIPAKGDRVHWNGQKDSAGVNWKVNAATCY